MKVGFVQFTPQRKNVLANIYKLQSLLKDNKADLFVLPELANSGYLYADPRELEPFSEPADGSGAFLSALKGFSLQTGAVIAAGFSEKTENGLYNSAALVSEEGVLQIYRKTHLFANEKDLFLPGNTGFRVLDVKGMKIGMMVCFDWVFPEAARSLALQGAQIIAHTANLVLPYCQRAMITRSLENGVFSITANRCGVEQLGETKLAFSGASQVLDNKGNLLTQAGENEDCVRIVEIDPKNAEDKMITARNHLLEDRRGELYT